MMYVVADIWLPVLNRTVLVYALLRRQQTLKHPKGSLIAVYIGDDPFIYERKIKDLYGESLQPKYQTWKLLYPDQLFDLALPYQDIITFPPLSRYKFYYNNNVLNDLIKANLLATEYFRRVGIYHAPDGDQIEVWQIKPAYEWLFPLSVCIVNDYL